MFRKKGWANVTLLGLQYLFVVNCKLCLLDNPFILYIGGSHPSAKNASEHSKLSPTNLVFENSIYRYFIVPSYSHLTHNINQRKSKKSHHDNASSCSSSYSGSCHSRSRSQPRIGNHHPVVASKSEKMEQLASLWIFLLGSYFSCCYCNNLDCSTCVD